MATKDQEILIDGLTSFEFGMNSGILPHLLAANQTAFSTNCTHRSGYISHRPPVNKMALNFGGSVALENSVRYGLFQGQCYFKSDYGEEGIVASISGRIFFFVYQGTQFLVRDVTPLTGGIDDPNSATNTVAWLWQSELWVIINDGQHLPIFFDGHTSRRSRGVAIDTVGTITAAFTTPAVNSTVNVTISTAYTGAFGATVLILGEHYRVESMQTTGVSAFLLTMTQTAGPTGTVNPSGFQLKTPSAFYSRIVGYLTTGVNPPGTTLTHSGTPWQINTNRWIEISRPYTGGLNQLVQFQTSGNVMRTAFVVSTANGGLYLELRSNSVQSFSTIIAAGVLQQFVPITWTNVTTTFGFTTPGIGASVTCNIDAQYLSGIGLYVYSSDGTQEYQVTATSIDNTLTYTLTLTNLDGAAAAHNAPPYPITFIVYELPAGRMGAYGLGRNWMCLPDGRSYIGSDIVGNMDSGTLAFQYRDSVLNVSENTYLADGGVFIIPGQLGDINSMTFTATLDTSLGQGPLQIGTASTVFSCNAPVDRTTWQSLTNPIQTESLKGRGPLGQYGTINVNSDTLFRSPDGLSSLVLARRDFQRSSWGNVPISREMQRVIEEDTKSLLGSSTATNFDNRFLVGCFPVQGPFGVYHRGMIAMNLDPVSTLRGKVDSIYDGLWTGLNVFQFCTGPFSGTYRTFAFCFDSADTRIELFEVLPSAKENLFDNNSIGITWGFETAPIFRTVKGKGQFDQVKLIDGEIYLSEIRGPVYVQVWYRPEFSECWTPWHSFQICADNADTVSPKQYRTAIGLGQPSSTPCDPTNNRPYRVGNNFQLRFQITGSCKFMGVMCKAVLEPAPQFLPPICDPVCNEIVTTNCEPCLSLPNCVRFGLVFYSINSGRTYVNALMCFDVTQSDGSIINICVPPGTISYTNPYDPDNTDPGNPIPPLTLRCPNGGVITRTVPPGATPAEITAIINQMLAACAQSWANDPNNRGQGVPPPGGGTGGATPITNDTVYYSFPCVLPSIPSYSGTLPSWITIDAINSRLVGTAGTFISNTKANANAIAQAALDGWALQQIGLGTLTCSTVCLGALTCTNSQQMVGEADAFIGYHPGTKTIWVCDSFSTDLFVVDSLAPYSIITTISLAAYSGAWDVVYDSKYNQMVVAAHSGHVLFIDPSTYVIVAVPNILHASSVEGHPIAYDPTRGYILCADFDRVGLNNLILMDCFSHAILVNNSQANPMGSPVYCSTTDCYYIFFRADPNMRRVDPVTAALSATALTLAGASDWLAYSWSFDSIGQIWGQRKDNTNFTGVIVIDPSTMTFLGLVSGADIPPTWSIQSMVLNTCDNIVEISDYFEIIKVETTTFTETAIDVFDPQVVGMIFVEDINAKFMAIPEHIITECPPV